MIKQLSREVIHQVNKIVNYKEENEVKNLIGNTQPIYHIHIRKTGGTTINFAFLSNGTTENLDDLYNKLSTKKNHRVISNEKVFVGWNLVLLNEGNYSFGFSHRP